MTDSTEQLPKTGINWEFIGVFLLFAISVVVRFKIADFPKIVWIQPDEFRYYLLAKSFSHRLGMSINGYPKITVYLLYNYKHLINYVCHSSAKFFCNDFIESWSCEEFLVSLLHFSDRCII